MKTLWIIRIIGISCSLIVAYVAVLGWLMLIKRVAVPSPSTSVIASFDNALNVTNWGADINSFDDSKFGYRSDASWHLKTKSESSSNNAMVLDIYLDKPLNMFTPYTGIMAYMSYEPHQIINMSDYSGIAFKIMKTFQDEGIEAYMQLVDTTTPDRAWHEIRIPLNQINQKGSFTQMRFNFSQFHYPDWYQTKKQLPLDVTRIYRVAFLFRNNIHNQSDARAQFIIDDIELFSDAH